MTGQPTHPITEGEREAVARVEWFANRLESGYVCKIDGHTLEPSDLRTLVAAINAMSSGSGAQYILDEQEHGILSDALKDSLTPCTIIPRASGSGWRPIETAPKDGTRILVCGAPPFWHYPFVVEWDAKIDAGAGWWKHSEPSLHALYSVSDSITAWMPCPPPPLDTLINRGRV